MADKATIIPDDVKSDISILTLQRYSHRQIRSFTGISTKTISKHQIAMNLQSLRPERRNQNYRQQQCEAHRGSVTGDKNPMYGKRGALSPHYGRKKPYYSDFMRGNKFQNGRKMSAESTLKKKLWFASHPEQCRVNAINACASSVRISKFERDVGDYLMKLGIKIITQFRYDLGLVDFYLPNINICLFCDGDRWHCNPKQFQSEDILIRDIKAKDIWEKDARQTEFLKSKGYLVVRLWESDFRRKPQILDELLSSMVTVYY